MATETDGAGEGAFPVSRIALVSGLCALLAAGAVRGVVPGPLGAAAAAWLLLGGLGLPIVARLSPAEPSPLKLALFGSLLSPLVALACWLALLPSLGADGALIGTYGVALLVQLLALGQRARLQPPGRAAWVALLLAALVAGFAAAAALRGSAPRVSYHGLLHAAIAQSVERGVPPENPFLAGTPLSYYWIYHGLGALVSRALGVAPTLAFAWINVWSALTGTLALYFAAAPVWRDGRADVLAVVFGALGLNAIGGWRWLLDGTPLGEPSQALDVLTQLRVAVATGDDPRLAVGISKLANASSHPVAMAYVCGALAASAHALRHAQRPWPILCGLCAGAAFALNPILGGGAILGLAAAAFLVTEKPRIGRRVLIMLGAGLVPGAALVALASGDSTRPLLALGDLDTAAQDPVVGLVLRPERVGELMRVVGPLLLPAILTLGGPGGIREDRPGRRTVLASLWLVALVPLALYPIVRLPEDNQYKLVRLAAVPLGLLAAGGLVRVWRGSMPWKLLALALGAPLLVGVVASNTLGGVTYLRFARASVPVNEEGGVLTADAETTAAGASDLARVWRRLRGELGPARPDLVLVANPLSDVAAVGAPGAFNLQGHEAPALTGLPVYVDRESYLVRHQPEWRGRFATAAALFAPASSPELRAAALAELGALGRPLAIVVTAGDLAAAPDLEKSLAAAGFEVLLREGSVAIRAR